MKQHNHKNGLERFIRDNREAFDNQEPPAGMWDKIGAEFGGAPKTTRVIQMGRVFRAVAATLILALAGTVAYMMFNKKEEVKPADIAKQETTKPASDSDTLINQIDPQYGQLVAQFTNVIEAKQNELRQIGKDDPALYQQFSGDIRKLDSAYHSLRNTLTENPNTEQLLQAMIGNLQMQIDLLNRQLAIIKKVKSPKAEKI